MDAEARPRARLSWRRCALFSKPLARCSVGRIRAVVVTNPGPAENLELAELADPTPRSGHVVVRVGATGVNPIDASNRADPSWAGIEPPYVVGYEFAGWIEEVGDEVIGVSAGDAVWGLCPVRGIRWGTYAEYVELNAGWIGRRPGSLSVVEAAAVPLTGSTALQLLDRLALESGQSVLVHGAGGGVGRMFVQLAHARGIRVAAAARQHRHPLLHDLGIELVLDREQDDVMMSAVDRLGCRFDAIADLAGHGVLATSLPGLRDGGSAGSIVELRGDLDDVIDRNVRLHGVLVRPDRGTLDRLAKAVDAGVLRSVVDEVVEPNSIVETHRALETTAGATATDGEAMFH